MLDDPFEAGLERSVQLRDRDFVGREALVAKRAAGGPVRRLRTLVIGDGEPVLAYGGEAVLDGDDAVGRLRSVAYGFTVGRTVGYAYLPADTPVGARFAVDVFGDRVPAEVTRDALHDPAGARIRA
jgi:4-methylaminobutanoate oxidase (formaldehyde-forming)